jgi:antitoxin PrlF
MRHALSSKGQVTVPIAVREKLGLRPGSVVHFEVVAGGALMKKGQGGRGRLDGVFGALRSDRSVDEVVDQMRGPRPRRRRG